MNMNTKPQTATLPAPNSHSNASRAYQEKALAAAWSVIAPAKDGSRLEEIIVVRWYMGRSAGASNVYCNVWIRGNQWNSGHGHAGGGGYHKQSAALGAALESAGVKLSQDIDGRGDSACREALAAVVKAMGYKWFSDEVFIVEHQ